MWRYIVDPEKPIPTWAVLLIMVVVGLAIGFLIFTPGTIDG